MRGSRWGIVILLLLGIGIGAFATYWFLQPRQGRDALTDAVRNTPLPVRSEVRSDGEMGLIAAAAEKIGPSVVTIDTVYRPRTVYGGGDFFGFGARSRVVPRGSGSGVIIDANGTIVTNNHVVQNAERINVTLRDGRELQGQVIGSDAQTDLAVVKVDATGLSAATLGDSDQARVGEWVVAVGNPLHVGMTVTAGIVSAIRTQADGDGESLPMASAIQTDAAINPGNSGGALADIEGRLLGINTAIASTTGGNIGIGFAIPVNMVREVTEQLIEHGRVIRPWLGITFGPITERARQVLNIPPNVQGVIVGDVLSGSPAAQAGLRSGDVILRANDAAINEAESLAQMVQKLNVGDRLQLRIWRQGNEQSVTATLQERPRTPVQG